ncbi:methyl-accepting chemotaxis protein [Pseudomonas stutzeri]|uniref:methyl-accepting chemotaxis protein n=1 Tax=Stutzerimonas stutzeri TaxID=316 RepID=UPI00210E9D58|nr:methyl-accepting chemotaxis protein [Stutzerimonas stutzeri]MCQ4287516.1 methyl-accepting chemotaxis protein [Stutzerimonas stutzeri]
MSLRKLTIPRRSVLGFGLIGLIVLLLGLLSLKQMGQMNAESKDVNEGWLPSIMALGDLNQHILRIRLYNLRLAVNRDAATLENTRATLASFDEQLKDMESAYKKTIISPQEEELFRQYQATRESYYKVVNEIIPLDREGRIQEMVSIIETKMNPAASHLSEALRALVAYNNQGAARSAERSSEIFDSAKLWTIFTIALAALLTFGLAWLFTRSIVHPLNQAVGIAETVASGNLTQDFIIDGNDEPARLLVALKAMQGNLRNTLQGISDSSNQLASAAEELNAVTEDSTRGLHQQNHEIEQAATAVNEMTAAVDEVARNAVATSEASRESDKTAQHGREQVIKTVESIGLLAGDVTTTASQVEQLAGQVRDISKVLDVIRSIAEQTNLLALNAAIEAARAGEAGRGFAVVADEVRALAHRTQQSTQEIEQMIGDVHQGTDKAVHAMRSSNERARSTLDVARTAGEALEDITKAISQISERNLVIASASEEQAQVAREVDRNLVNIRDLSLQSSAGANQTSAASQELSHLATRLNEMVARFRI